MLSHTLLKSSHTHIWKALTHTYEKLSYTHMKSFHMCVWELFSSVCESFSVVCVRAFHMCVWELFICVCERVFWIMSLNFSVNGRHFTWNGRYFTWNGRWNGKTEWEPISSACVWSGSLGAGVIKKIEPRWRRLGSLLMGNIWCE